MVCDPDSDMCIKKGAFNTGHGGKEVVPTTAAVTTMRFEIAGTFVSGAPLEFTADSVSGTLSAFNYATRLLIQSHDFMSFQGNYLNQAGVDFEFTSEAMALANGVPMPIQFNASSIGGVYTFEVLDPGGGFLAGGVGEDGRSDLELTLAPIES
jgi:hypothetical protein